MAYAELPVNVPPSGTSWRIKHEEAAAPFKPKTPAEAEALKIHQKWQPRLVSSTGYRLGNEYLRIDEYGDGRTLQTYANSRWFIEEVFSGGQVVATSRSIEEILQTGRALVFFPELRGFERAQSLGAASSGEDKGLLKYVLRARAPNPEDDGGVRQYLAQQGVEYVAERPVEEYLLVHPDTKLPAAYTSGGLTKTYIYKSASFLPPLSPAIKELIRRLESARQNRD